MARGMKFVPSLNCSPENHIETPLTLLDRAAQLKERQDRIAERIEKVIGTWWNGQRAFSTGPSLLPL